MKYLVNKIRWLQVAIVIAASIFLVSGIAYAVVSVDKPVPGTVSVNFQANPEGTLGFYSDAACTVPLTTLNFGELKPV
ncbi:MAG: hypothetical protein HY673_13975 [Chloroflexi bacterium]|nr:hypothetical protein [Chloroflexota bacterium]